MGAFLWRPKRWTVVLLCVLGVIVGLGAVVGLYTGIGPYDLPPKSRQLDEVLSVSKSLGLPMTQEELVGEIPPDDQNAAPEFLRILESLNEYGIWMTTAAPSDDPEEQKEQLAWLAANSDALDALVGVAIERPAWYVERDWDMGPFLLFPEYAKLKDVAKILALRGRLNAEKGAIEKALNDFLAAKRLSETISTDRTLIAILVGIAIDSIVLRSLEHYVEAWRNDAESLGRLETLVADNRSVKNPTAALRLEFYFSLNFCRNFKKFGGLDVISELASSGGTEFVEPDPSEVQRTGPPNGVFLRASMTTIAELWNEVFAEINDKGVHESDWSSITTTRISELESRFRASEILAKILFPVFSQVQLSIQNDAVYQDLALAYVRCMRYHAENGKWPDSLKDIDADFPDPFAPGKTIQAKFATNELRVWGVGRGGKDNGGVLKTEDSKSDDDVYVWPSTLRGE